MNFIKGQSVARIMTRYNPQLGTYYIVSKAVIKNVAKTVITLKNEHDNIEKYDLEGNRKNTPKSLYGSSDYTIMSEEKAIEYIKDVQSMNGRISGYLCESAIYVLNDAGKKLLNSINSILQGKES